MPEPRSQFCQSIIPLVVESWKLPIAEFPALAVPVRALFAVCCKQGRAANTSVEGALPGWKTGLRSAMSGSDMEADENEAGRVADWVEEPARRDRGVLVPPARVRSCSWCVSRTDDGRPSSGGEHAGET